MEKTAVADHPVDSPADVEKPTTADPRSSSSGGQENTTSTAPPQSLPSADELRVTPYLSVRTLARWLLVASALLAVGWLLWNARTALSPFAMGLVLAYLFLPIVNALARHMPRSVAILIVYVGVIALIIGAIAYVVPPVVIQIQQLIASIPSVDQLQEVVTHLLQQYQSRVPEVIRQPINEGLDNALRDAQTHLTLYVQQVGGFLLSQVFQLLNIASFLVGFLIVPIWLFYVLNDVGQGHHFLDRLLHPRLRDDFWIIWGIVNQVLGNYVRGQIVLGVSVGVMVGAGLLVLQLLDFRVSYILLLTIFAGVTELVPLIGPWLGAIPGVLLALLVSPQTTMAVVIVYVIVQQIEINFLRTRVVGESIGIHPAILMVILIAMGYSFGLLGIVLAAPISAIARDLFIYVHRRLDGVPAVKAGISLTVTPQKTHRRA
jgi:predicted PurR-regulated permease PerM